MNRPIAKLPRIVTVEFAFVFAFLIFNTIIVALRSFVFAAIFLCCYYIFLGLQKIYFKHQKTGHKLTVVKMCPDLK
ncbi:MAG TPA: hypothetical protein VF817_01040 [Patescibacteria group bacterium]